ncbi:MAG: DUF815 domain-containing protein [Clostridiales bacterium]|nr:DUF815 domain-containing protein [Clostridiales bacterium]
MRLAALSVFEGLKADPVVRALEALLADAGNARTISDCARLAALLFEAGRSLTDYLYSRALRDENPYVRRLAAGETISSALKDALGAELATLQLLGGLRPDDLLPDGISFPVARWEVEEIDFSGGYHRHMANIREAGYGAFADHHVFLLRDGELKPVLHPDPVDFDKLTGYARERGEVERNTAALVNGLPCSNVLLYGDSGTGKSTTVKALANRFRNRGLRLIELRRDQLGEIPWLIDRLCGNPLKFILFIDDLSFASGGDHFSQLKAILEGSVTARAANIAIYATSNRRHLVRENFRDREGGEIHLRDTLEEISSLSERFGLTVTFLRPDRALYLDIARRYCEEMLLPFDGEVARAAEAFALNRGGRSPRTARQFAENLATEQRREPQ